MLFHEGSRNHVSPTQQQESDLAKKMTATCGPKCLELFEKFDRPGSWAKMFSALLIGMEGWYSTKCKLTWKLRATKYNRMYFQLVPSTPRIVETEFGLLPTPTASLGDPKHRNYLNNKNNDDTCRKFRKLVQGGMLPTPTASDHKGGCIRKSDKFQFGTTLSHFVTGATSQLPNKTFHLSPEFVEEMMGFPIGWTDPNFQHNYEQPSFDHFPTQQPISTEKLADRQHRLKALGNAIVPQVALQIFKAIEQYETHHHLPEQTSHDQL